MLGDTNTVLMSINAQEKMVNTSGCYIVEHWNGVKIPKMWVLDQKECIEIFQVVCLESYYSETFNQMHADTSFSQQVVCVDEMAWNLQKHEFWT